MIDFHAHIFPEKIAERAINMLSETGGNMMNYSDGLKDSLIKIMDKSEVTRSVVLNIATNEKQMISVNDFAISINGYKDRLVSFGSIYPHSEGAVEEIYRLRENGIKGLKLHPEYQNFFVDDEKLAPIYEAINKLNMLLIFHAGMDNGFYDEGKANPKRFKNIAKSFKTPLILAHMGGYLDWYNVEKHLVGENVYFDTSFCFSRIPLPLMQTLVEKHGADRILFGSDMPWSTPLLEKRLIDSLKISDQDKMKIFHLNAEKILRR